MYQNKVYMKTFYTIFNFSKNWIKDGANVEMSEEMGGKNIFIFGMKVEDVIALDQRGYNPMEFYQKSSNLRRCLDQIRAGLFR